ncbi:protogenin B-like [Ylistrum balloti]|uniref:protogenin B-like n=1 Tax=Ylistrum balloti TaxID=509963 RepID=UPI002905B59C|nr:protogenin B-like [Ylistrum balloti]
MELEAGVVVIPGPPTVIVQRRSPLRLNCSAFSTVGFGPTSYRWTRNRQEVTLNKRIQLAENGSLYFQHLKRRKRPSRSDEGMYECFLNNSKGVVIGRQVLVKVARIASKFTKMPADQETVVEGVARFECKIEATPPPVYIWEKDDSSLPINNRTTTLASGVLQIHDVRAEDAGTYHCSAQHRFQDIANLQETVTSMSRRHSEAGILTVTHDQAPRPPKIVYATDEVIANSKESVTLECLVDGYPKPSVRWLTQNDSQVVENLFKMRVGVSNLKFKELVVTDEGTYRCVASSPGHTDAVAEVKLKVRVPPVLTGPLVSHKVQSAQRIRLDCPVSGRPKPKIAWYRNGAPLTAHGRISITEQNVLLIESILSDSGYYQCQASNAAGSVMTTARIEVIQKDNSPGKTQNFTVTVLSATEVFAEWAGADSPVCCPVVAYTLHYRKIGGSSKEQKAIVTGTSRKLNKLDIFSEYEFYVKAYAKEGAGEESRKIRVTTMESVPSAVPTIETTSTSPTNIQVTWSELPRKLRNGIITRHQIRYKTQSSQSKIIEVTSNVTSYMITGLRSDTDYLVLVLAGTDVGYPTQDENFWTWTLHHTPGRELELPAPELEVMMVNNNTVRFLWNVGNVSETVLGYRLSIHKILEEEGVTAEVTEVNATVTSLYKSGLEPEKFYEAVLMVLGSNGKVVGLVTLLFQTHNPNMPALPPPPVDLEPHPLSSTSVSFSWRPPRTPQEIRFYTVQYSTANNSHKVTVRSDLPQIVLENLEPFTWYNLSVRSHTNILNGPYSSPVLVRTKEGVPTAPGNIQIKSLAKDKVRLSWTAPAKVNGEIVSYMILYNREPGHSDDLWTSISKNGSSTSAVIRDLSDDTYYFKLKACTRAGSGPSSPVIQVILKGCSLDCSPDNPPKNQHTGTESPLGAVPDQKLGIIIGCSVGLSSIIICIIVILLKQRHYTRLAQHQANFHQNGSVLTGQPNKPHNDDSLPMLQENIHSDSKGPGNGTLFLGNGRVIYICSNGHGNGRLRAVVAEPRRQPNGTTQVPEQTALLLEDADRQQLTFNPRNNLLSKSGSNLTSSQGLSSREPRYDSDHSVTYDPGLESVTYDPGLESISRSQTGSPSSTTDNSPHPGRACSLETDKISLNPTSNSQTLSSKQWPPGDGCTTVLTEDDNSGVFLVEDDTAVQSDVKIDNSCDMGSEDDCHSNKAGTLSSDELLFKMYNSTTSSVDYNEDTLRNVSASSSTSNLAMQPSMGLPQTYSSTNSAPRV